MQFKGVNNKECLHSCSGTVCESSVLICACTRTPCAPALRSIAAFTGIAFTVSIVLHGSTSSSIPPPFPPPFPLIIQCDRCLSSPPWGGSWLGFQDLPPVGAVFSSSRSWLPIVEVTGCLRLPNLHGVMQLAWCTLLVYTAKNHT